MSVNSFSGQPAIPASYGFTAGKNKIINGDFGVWQRGTSSSSVNGYFTADRWYNGGGGTVTISQSTDIPTGVCVQFSQKWLTGASSSFGQYYYAFEQAVVKPLRGQSMVLSYYIKTAGSHTGNINTTITYSNSTDALLSQTTNVTATGDTAYTASSVTSWVRKSVTFTVPADAVGLRINILPDTTQASGVSEFLTGVQLEAGATATSFQTATGTLQGELAACQRYYFRYTGNASAQAPIGTGFAFASTQAQAVIAHPTTMRTTPSLSYSAAADITFTWSAGTSSTSSLNPDLGSPQFLLLRINTSGLTVGTGGYYRIETGTSKYLELSAEL